MTKHNLIKDVVHGLTSTGFRISCCEGIRSSFDVLARRGDLVLVIKVLSNIDGFTQSTSRELKQVAAIIKAVPLVVGYKTKRELLRDGVLYLRYGVHVVNTKTFLELLENKLPRVYAIRGDYCVCINPEELARKRMELGLSQRELAEKLGISKQSIYRYESTGRVSMDIAQKLLRIMEDDFLEPVKVLESSFTSHFHFVNEQKYITKLKRMVFRKFKEFGLTPALTNAPFDLVAIDRAEKKRERKKDVFTVVSNDPCRMQHKVEIVEEISEMLDSYSICISNRKLRTSLVLKPSLLEKMSEKAELWEYLE